MGWDYTRVKTDDGCIALMSDDRLVVIDAWETGGGGTGLTGTDSQIADKLQFRLEYDIDGIKAFVTEDLFKLFGTVSENILKIIVLTGILKYQTTTKASINGVLAKTIEGYLDLAGITNSELIEMIEILGVTAKDVETFENVVGTKSK